MNEEWEEDFDKRFVYKQLDINGNLAYEEFLDIQSVPQVKRYISYLIGKPKT